MENDQIAVLAVVALLLSVIGLGVAAYTYTYSDSGQQAIGISQRVSTWRIIDEAVTNAKIADDTIKDANFNQSDVKFLNYSAAGTVTANKLIVGNGSSVTGHASLTEGGLTTIDYLLVKCTSNHTVTTSYDLTGANTFDVYLYSVGSATEATTAESVNWTAIGT